MLSSIGLTKTLSSHYLATQCGGIVSYNDEGSIFWHHHNQNLLGTREILRMQDTDGYRQDTLLVYLEELQSLTKEVKKLRCLDQVFKTFQRNFTPFVVKIYLSHTQFK